MGQFNTVFCYITLRLINTVYDIADKLEEKIGTYFINQNIRYLGQQK